MEENNLNVVTKKKNPKTLLASITIIVLFAFLLVVTFMYFNSPRRKFVSHFTKFYNQIVEKSSSNKTNNILKNNIVGIKGETSINWNIQEGLIEEEQNILEIINMLKKIDLSYDYQENKDNNTASLNFDSKIANEDFIKLEALAKENKIYFNLKNLLDKYYYIDYEFTSLLSVIDEKDTKYVLDILKDVVVDKVTSDYFSSEKTTVKINDIDEKAERVTLEFDDKLLKDIFITIIDELKNNKKAMDILVEYNKIEKEEIIETLDSAKKSLTQDTSSSNQKYTYNMYLQSSKVLKQEIIVGTTSIEYFTYSNIDEIKILDNAVEQASLKFEQKDNQTTISGNIASMLTISGTYVGGKLDLSVGVMGVEMAKLNVTTTENVSDNKIDTTLNATLKILEGETDMLTINIDSKNTISKEKAIDEKDVTNSVNAEDITEEDQETFTNNLMKLPLINKIYESIIFKTPIEVEPSY